MKKKWLFISVMIIMFSLIIGGCYVFTQKRDKEADYTEILNTSNDISAHLIGDEGIDYDLLNREVEQILSSYKNVSSEFMIHCETSGNDISKIELTVKCSDNLSNDIEISIRKQLAEVIGLTENDVLLKTLSLSKE